METKKTPLYDWHLTHGANMVDFGRYNMPLWYPAGAKNEHLAVLTKAGIFDTSHMAAVMISGPGAFELLQLCFTRNLNACIGKKKTPIVPGRAVYGVYLDKYGNLIDDTIVYQISSNRYMTVVNAGMGGEVARHLISCMNPKNTEVIDLTDRIGKIDIQGPASGSILKKVLKNPDNIFENMPYFSFKGDFDQETNTNKTLQFIDDTSALLSRTGYTGEFGFEIFTSADKVAGIWEIIFESGKEFGITPCGLAARDSLRTGATLPLSRQDIGQWPFINNPWTFVLPFNSGQTGFTKEFIGSKILEYMDKADYTYPFAGYDLRKVSASNAKIDAADVLDLKDNKIGMVLTCVTEMGIGRTNGRIYSISSPDKPDGFNPEGLCCGFIKVKSKLAAGEIVNLKDKRRKIEVMIVDSIRPDRTALRPLTEMIRR